MATDGRIERPSLLKDNPFSRENGPRTSAPSPFWPFIMTDQRSWVEPNWPKPRGDRTLNGLLTGHNFFRHTSFICHPQNLQKTLSSHFGCRRHFRGKPFISLPRDLVASFCISFGQIWPFSFLVLPSRRFLPSEYGPSPLFTDLKMFQKDLVGYRAHSLSFHSPKPKSKNVREWTLLIAPYLSTENPICI